MVKRIAARINIPFTVGGGIHSLADVDRLLNAGADKVSLNSAALKNPQIIEEVAKNFGSQVCVIAIDANFEDGNWICYLNGGRPGGRRNTVYQYRSRRHTRRLCLRRLARVAPAVACTGNCLGRSRDDGPLQGGFCRRRGRCRSGSRRIPFRGDCHPGAETIFIGRGYPHKIMMI